MKSNLSEEHFAENPHKVDVGDWVFFKGKVGQIKSIAKKKKDFLQFWVLWDGDKIESPELARNLQKVDKPVSLSSDRPAPFLLSSLIIDENLQQREKLNQAVIDEYALAYSLGEKLPPITTWYCTDNKYDYERDHVFLVDGFHRVAAAKIAGLTQLPHTQLSGTYREAVLYSMSVNSTHGLRRSNADKRKAVLTLLNDDEWKELSTRELAEIANVSHQLVHNLRTDLKNKEKEIKEKMIYPEDAIKFLDSDDDPKEKPQLLNKSLPPDIKLKDKKEKIYTLELQKPTLEALKEFINSEDLISGEGAILRLLELIKKES